MTAVPGSEPGRRGWRTVCRFAKCGRSNTHWLYRHGKRNVPRKGEVQLREGEVPPEPPMGGQLPKTSPLGKNLIFAKAPCGRWIAFRHQCGSASSNAVNGRNPAQGNVNRFPTGRFDTFECTLAARVEPRPPENEGHPPYGPTADVLPGRLARDTTPNAGAVSSGSLGNGCHRPGAFNWPANRANFASAPVPWRSPMRGGCW